MEIPRLGLPCGSDGKKIYQILKNDNINSLDKFNSILYGKEQK